MLPPHEARNFIHKSRFTRGLIGGITGGLTGGPGGVIGGFSAGFAPRRPSRRRGGSPRAPRTRTTRAARPRVSRQPAITLAAVPLASTPLSSRRCPRGQKRIAGVCVDLGAAAPGGDPLFSAASGAAIMGRYGAGLTPLGESRVVLDCLPGMVLGTDDICYNKRDLRNNERKWPKGRRPLGTPGEMAALSKAASFGRRMEATVKRMQKIGVLKKPARRAAPKARAPKQLAPGPSIINVE